MRIHDLETAAARFPYMPNKTGDTVGLQREREQPCVAKGCKATKFSRPATMVNHLVEMHKIGKEQAKAMVDARGKRKPKYA